MNTELKLYVWDDFAPGYYDGLAFAIATSEEEAKDIIISNMGGYIPLKWSRWNICKIYPLTQKIGFGITGGE